VRVIAHVSDSHFGTVDRAVCDALLDDLRATPPDLVVLTGDITQRARRTQFGAARRFLDALPPVPRLAVPGNHDIPLFDLYTRLADPRGRFRRFVSADPAPLFDDDEMLVIGFDSTHVLRRKDGQVGAADREHIARRLASASRPWRVVAMHHPLAVPAGGESHNVVHGAPAALERWIGAGADLFLGGHIHLPYVEQVRDKRGRAAHVVHAGTCMSRRVRAGMPNSYNRLYLGDEHARIERHDHDAVSGTFRPVAERAVRRAPR